MNYFRKIFEHYMILALERQVNVDGDTYVEIEGALDDLQEYIDQRIDEACAKLAERK